MGGRLSPAGERGHMGGLGRLAPSTAPPCVVLRWHPPPPVNDVESTRRRSQNQNRRQQCHEITRKPALRRQQPSGHTSPQKNRLTPQLPPSNRRPPPPQPSALHPRSRDGLLLLLSEKTATRAPRRPCRILPSTTLHTGIPPMSSRPTRPTLPTQARWLAARTAREDRYFRLRRVASNRRRRAHRRHTGTATPHPSATTPRPSIDSPPAMFHPHFPRLGAPTTAPQPRPHSSF